VAVVNPQTELPPGWQWRASVDGGAPFEAGQERSETGAWVDVVGWSAGVVRERAWAVHWGDS
jgi:hypothetical protein